MTRRSFEAQAGPLGALLVGSPEEVAEKISPAFRSAWWY